MHSITRNTPSLTLALTGSFSRTASLRRNRDILEVALLARLRAARAPVLVIQGRT
jgi:hypothetical protein